MIRDAYAYTPRLLPAFGRAPPSATVCNRQSGLLQGSKLTGKVMHNRCEDHLLCTTWSGMCTAADLSRLNSFIIHCKRLGFCHTQLLLVTELFSEADELLFQKTLQNTHHVLQPYLPESSELCYNLRNRTHIDNKLLIDKTSHLNDDDFIIRMLYKDSY